MSSNVTQSSATATNNDTTNHVASPQDKGKGKIKTLAADESMEEEEEGEEEEEEGEEEEEEEEEEEGEETFEDIDPSVIIGGRRTRGVKVDYNSKEALAKAGLQDNEHEEDSEDEEAMKE
ncbi:hypothetical protein L208DRAFT_1412109 [Tricholoma matsutake]|nr:hypothetical protein L208DRAFT_1412109 [Tricholoma matsutake 945]